MKTIIKFLIDENMNKDVYDVDIPMVLGCDATLTIYTKGDIPVEEVLARVDKKDVTDKINFLKQFYTLQGDSEIFSKELIDADSILNNVQIYMFDASRLEYNYLFDYMEYEDYESDYSQEEISDVTYKYIMSNPFFKDKTIVVNDLVNFKTEPAEIIDRYKGYDHLYVKPQESIEPIPIESLENPLKKFIDDVKKLNLTPLELSILVYDFVREKVYKMESDDQLPSQSRDMYSTLQNDEIVCMGYANIYSEIMNQLGVKCEVLLLDGIDEEHSGHARNIIKLYDDEYDVHGLFILDPTFDSRNSSKDKDWLYQYQYFMKKRKDFVQVDKRNDLVDNVMGYLDYFSIDDLDTLVEYYTKDYFEMLRTMGKFDENYKRSHKFVNLLDRMYNDDFDLNASNEDNISKFKKEHAVIARDYKEPLDTSTFFKALAKVRLIESKIDSSKYPYDINELFRRIPSYEFKEKDEQRIINLPHAASILLKTLFDEPFEEITYETEEEKEKLLEEGYKALAISTHRTLMSEDKEGKYKVVKSIKLYNNKGKKKKK